MAKRGLKFPNGFIKTEIMKYAIKHWDGFYESDLRDYLRTIKYRTVKNGKKIVIEGVKDSSTIKDHLKDLREAGYLELVRESDGYYSNFWRVNLYKLCDAIKDFETFGKFTKDLLSFMQKSEEILDWIYNTTKPESPKEFLCELIVTNIGFLIWLLNIIKKSKLSNVPLEKRILCSIEDEQLWRFRGFDRREENLIEIRKDGKKAVIPVALGELLLTNLPQYTLFTIWKSILSIEGFELDTELEELSNTIANLSHIINKLFWEGTGVNSLAKYILSEKEIEDLYRSVEEIIYSEEEKVIEKNEEIKSLKALKNWLYQRLRYYELSLRFIYDKCLEKLIKSGVITKFDEHTIYIAQELGIVGSDRSKK